jgi:tRNA pseudouridine38-40 synthase
VGIDRRPFALQLAYDGRAFKGWQKQPGLQTVQQAVERALAAALDHAAEVHGAARTDAGVHAAGQVCHFVRERLDPGRLPEIARRLSAELPPAIRLLALRPAVPSFHARSSSTGKRYVYRFAWGAAAAEAAAWHLGPAASPDWGRARAALVDIGQLPALPGLASPSSDRRPAPPLAAWSIREPAGEATASLSLRAPAFRRHEVRNLAGHLATIALGLAAPESLAPLCRRARPWMGAQAPPWGLCLEEVLYPAPLDPFADPPRG